MTAEAGIEEAGEEARAAVERGGAWRVNLAAALAVSALSLPAALGVGAGALRLLYPAAVLAIAAALVLRERSTGYLVFVLWLFTLTPLVRRLVDHRVGWLDANTVMLAPYAACAVSLVALPTLLRGGTGLLGRRRLIVMLLAVGYGALLALVEGRLVSGLYDALRWTLPMALAGYLLLAQRHGWTPREAVEAYFALALILCSAYGVWQFVVAPPWDGFWMVHSGMESIGRPAPFEIRVFSTWNSPGSFSFFLLAGILVVASSRVGLRDLALALGLVALALTLVRSAWVAVPVGFAVLLALGTARLRLRLLSLAALAALALPLLALDPRVETLLVERVGSLSRLAADTSADDRLAAYAALAAELDAHPEGLGLAIAGGYAEADGGQGRILDGGFLEVPLALGVVGGALYILAAILLGLEGLRAAWRRPALAGYGAVIAVFGLLFLSGTTTVGEIGLFFWLALAILLGADLGGSPPAPDARSSH